jgi:hypothetical protein
MGQGMVRYILATILFLSIGSAAQAEPPPLSVVLQEIMGHRGRVPKHGITMFEDNPDLYPTLHRLPHPTAMRLIMAQLSLHDVPKTMRRSELLKYGYKFSKSILAQLREYWGQHLDSKPPFIHELNRIEDELKKERMETELADIDPKLHQAILQEIASLEHSADITDTKIFRGRELGFERIAFSAEAFLMEAGDSTAAMTSRRYEQKYYPMTTNSCKAVYR